jgi:hypothetical protein
MAAITLLVSTRQQNICAVFCPGVQTVASCLMLVFESRGRDTDGCAILRLLLEQRQESRPQPDHDSPVQIMSTFDYQQISQEYRPHCRVNEGKFGKAGNGLPSSNKAVLPINCKIVRC